MVLMCRLAVFGQIGQKCVFLRPTEAGTLLFDPNPWFSYKFVLRGEALHIPTPLTKFILCLSPSVKPSP